MRGFAKVASPLGGPVVPLENTRYAKASLSTGLTQSFAGSLTEQTRSSNVRSPSTFPSRMKIPFDAENPASLPTIRAFLTFRGLVKIVLTLESLTRSLSSYRVDDAGNRANGMPAANSEWTSAGYSYARPHPGRVARQHTNPKGHLTVTYNAVLA